VINMVEDGKRHFSHACFMEVTMIASWAIWIHRNNLIFNNVPISFAGWKMEFRELLLLCKYRLMVGLHVNCCTVNFFILFSIKV
jgi:hypothetical protein